MLYCVLNDDLYGYADIGFIEEHNEGAYSVGKYCKAYIPHYEAIMATTIAQEA